MQGKNKQTKSASGGGGAGTTGGFEDKSGDWEQHDRVELAGVVVLKTFFWGGVGWDERLQGAYLAGYMARSQVYPR